VFAAKKRSGVRIPGLLFEITPKDVNDEDAMRRFEAAVVAGSTAVVLRNDSDSAKANTRTFFDAALVLKEKLRGRASLLIADRTDIASSVEADGVVLGDDGVPVVVARKSFGNAPSVVCVAAATEKQALVAAKEGADFVLVPDASILESVAGEISVPIFCALANGDDWSSLGDAKAVSAAVRFGARGFFFRKPPPDGFEAADAGEALAQLSAALKGDATSSGGASIDAVSFAGDVEAAKRNRSVASRGSSSGLTGKLIDGASLRLLERERILLDEAVSFLQYGAPELEEIDLLIDARKGLEELFLLVIVGEFNAGKSSVINAVLGEKYLKEGILPTTNEITVLRYGEKITNEQSKDGFYTRTLPAELLKEVNIVDTPGTNVILERQQRLTEEFVPRADLVLFVLSADRPMTESEVKFLTYIKKWGKKVVFIVNKCDRLENEQEVEEVKQFVVDNAVRLLGVTDPFVAPVSAKAALAAKKNGTPLSETGFDELEDYVLSFLGGGGSEKGGSRSGEGMRLKLDTPLQVSQLLFTAAEQILATERASASKEVQAATGVGKAMERYADAMIDDFGTQLTAVRACVLRSVSRCDELLDSTLRLTNGVELFTTYVLGDGGGAIRRVYKSTVLGDAETELRSALAEHTGWLARNNSNQLDAYAEAVKARGFDPALTDLGLSDVITAVPTEEAEVVSAPAPATDSETSEDSEKTISEKIAEDAVPNRPSSADLLRRRYSATRETSALTIAAFFDHKAAAMFLEEEIKNAVYATVGAAGGAFLVAIFLSGFLDSFAEDVLAFSVTAAVGYVSVLSLPLKRADIKQKVRAVAEDFLAETEKAMRAEFERKTLAATRQVLAMTAPWSKAAVETETEIKSNQAKRDALQESLDQLRRDVQSL
jgi:small GTP-binding protein